MAHRKGTSTRRADGWRPDRRGTLAVLAGIVFIAAGSAALIVTRQSEDSTSQPSTPSAPNDASGPAFGVLGSTCNSDRAAALYKAGVRYAEVFVDWSSLEPRAGDFDQAYAAKVERALDQCNRAGLRVVLTLGLHAAPSWVARLPTGTYRDQNGHSGPDDVPNVVFSAAVRKAVAHYLAELNQLIDLNSLAAIRVGTGVNGEMGYPGMDTGTANPFWAFDTAAQTGSGLAAGATVSPMPGWTPGSSTWRGADVSTADVARWFRWYSDADADAVVWVIRQLRGLGYTHDIHLPLAGRGVLPADLDRALAARLDGTADRDGSLGSGLDYPAQLQRIAQSLARTEHPGWGKVYADSSSVDDATAVAARQLQPPQDSCRPGDATSDLLTDPSVQDWSSFRWTIANARHAGLGVIGENPGPPNAPGTGGNDRTDSIDKQIVHATHYAQECGMSLFMFAFEDELFSDHRAELEAYAQQIRGVTAGRRRPSRPKEARR